MSEFRKLRAGAGEGKQGSFFIVLNQEAVELTFHVGQSGIGKMDLSDVAPDTEEFIKGLVALVVDETEQGNLLSAARVAALLADYYARDVLVLDAQMHQNDILVGEMHFVEGDTMTDRRAKALDLLNECLNPAASQVLH